MQSTNNSNLKKRKIEFEPGPDLIDWQIQTIREIVPREALISALFALHAENGQEVGIEIWFEYNGVESVTRGFMQ